MHLVQFAKCDFLPWVRRLEGCSVKGSVSFSLCFLWLEFLWWLAFWVVKNAARNQQVELKPGIFFFLVNIRLQVMWPRKLNYPGPFQKYNVWKHQQLALYSLTQARSFSLHFGTYWIQFFVERYLHAPCWFVPDTSLLNSGTLQAIKSYMYYLDVQLYYFCIT